jgi:hypothetical protein
VIEFLKLKSSSARKAKILWTEEGEVVIVNKGTPQSSYKKTMLRRGGRTAVPKHVQKALNLRPTLQTKERIVWLLGGGKMVVRKG